MTREKIQAALRLMESGRWRVGGKVPLNVYEDDKPMFQCHTPEDAARIVALLNRGGAPAQEKALLEPPKEKLLQTQE